MPNNDQPILALDNVQFAYDDVEMRFNLSVNKGEVLAILGASGSGKSTLLDLIAGFNLPSSGDIRVNDESIAHREPAKRPMTSLFQEHNLFSHLTVFQNIAIGLSPNMKLDRAQQQQLELAAKQVNLFELLERLPAQLSGGQRQRIGIARCLARQQPILLLDEPFSALDPALKKEMLRLIQKLSREQYITVLMVTHNPDDALEIADNIAFIDNGTVHFNQPASIIRDENAPVILQQYLGTLTN